MQNIPVSETLKALLEDPAVRQECAKSHSHAASTVLSEAMELFKSINVFIEPGSTLELILYQEAFEVVNPLGPARRKLKIVGVYVTLYNFESFHHSCVDNLHHVILCSEKDFKHFAYDKLYAKMLSGLRDLKRDGIVTRSGQVMQTTVLCIVADILGSHSLFENFSRSSYCSTIEMHHFTEQFPVRTVETYTEAVQELHDTAGSKCEGSEV